MRDRTLPVNTAKLKALNTLHRPTRIARSLGITKQRYFNFYAGLRDMPEPLIDRLCETYNLEKSELVLAT
jgi:hypothetical protein